ACSTKARIFVPPSGWPKTIVLPARRTNSFRAFGNNETDAAALWHGLLTVPRQPTVGLPGIPRPARGPGDLRSDWVARSGDRATTRATTRVAHCFRTLLGSARTDWTRSPARSRTGWNVLRYFQI